jgi:hypothetical protein
MNLVKRTIYSLKRRYGFLAVYSHIVSVTNDIDTGLESITTSDTTINRMILLPSQLTRELLKGGTDYDIRDKYVLIDALDINIIPVPNDYIRWGGFKFVVSEVEIFERSAAYIIRLKESAGTPVTLTESISDPLTLSEVITDDNT